jgi:hypothetical protein
MNFMSESKTLRSAAFEPLKTQEGLNLDVLVCCDKEMKEATDATLMTGHQADPSLNSPFLVR